MRVISKVLKGIYVVYAGIVWLAIMLVILLPIVAVSFLGKVRGGNLVFYFLRFWAHVWFPAVGIFVSRKWKTPEPRSPVFTSPTTPATWMRPSP